MWKKGKKRADEEGPAGDDDADWGGERKKLARKADDDGVVVCDISKNRRVSVRSWQGKVVVDIREFYTKDGKELPGKKDYWRAAADKGGGWEDVCADIGGSDRSRIFGISLTMEQWNILKEHVDEIDKLVAENA